MVKMNLSDHCKKKHSFIWEFQKYKTLEKPGRLWFIIDRQKVTFTL